MASIDMCTIKLRQTILYKTKDDVALLIEIQVPALALIYWKKYTKRLSISIESPCIEYIFYIA
jgi:hypothetical protein